MSTSCCLKNLSMNFCHLPHDLGRLTRCWIGVGFTIPSRAFGLLCRLYIDVSINDVDLLRFFLLLNYLGLMTLLSLSRLTALLVTRYFNHIVRSLGWEFIRTGLCC
jgi:hypothetical protein